LLEKDAATHRWHTSPAVRAREPKTRLVSARDAARVCSAVHRDSRPKRRAAGAASAAHRLNSGRCPAAHGGVRGVALGSAAAVAPHAPDVEAKTPTGAGCATTTLRPRTRGSPPRFDRAFPRRSRGGSRTRRRRRARAGRLPTRGEAISCPSRVRIRLVLPSRECQGRGDGADAGLVGGSARR